MSLQLGSRLGPYEVAAQIGSGGMGEVYKATASLNHPNIAAIYGLERAETTTALVMELAR